MGTAEDDVVVSDRIPEEIVREDSRIHHLEEHLSAAQVTSVLVLNEDCLLAEHAPEVCRGLEDSNIAFCHLTVNSDSYSRLEMRVVGVPLDHIERYGAVREQHCSGNRVYL